MNTTDKPIEDYTVKIFVEGVRGCYRACFKIGVQTFHVCEREDKSEADWYAGCLQTAFDHYALFLGFAAGKLLKEKDQEIAELKAALAEHDKLTDKEMAKYQAIQSSEKYTDPKKPYFGSQQEEIDREQDDLTNSQMQ